MNSQSSKWILRALVAAAFIGVGAYHFVNPTLFVRMMPSFLPWHLELVWLSGVFEILGGVGLLIPMTRLVAVRGLLVLLAVVWIANWNLALNCIDPTGTGTVSCWMMWVRLPLQFVIAWAVWVSR
jgi:uncharacterized membrane protein